MHAGMMMLADGRFPAGGHTNSAGVEAAVRLGDVHDDRTLERYLVGRLATTGIVDAAFAASTAGVDGAADLAIVDAEYSARVLSPALRASSRRLGRQLLRAGTAVWSSRLLDVVKRTEGGPHQAIVLGAVVAAGDGTPHDAASISMHHLSSAVTSAAVRLLGLDPMTVAAVQARAATRAAEWLADPQAGVDHWINCAPADLPAAGGSLTEILAEHHRSWDARLFVA